MKVKVAKEFRDRTEDLKLRKKGQTLEVSAERAVILEGLGLVKRIQEEPEKPDKKKGETEQAEETPEKVDSAE